MQETHEWVLPDGARVPAAITHASAPKALLLLAPHASSGLDRPFTTELASMLAVRGITCARFDFPFMHSFSKRPDSPNVLGRIVHDVAALARQHAPGLPFFLGGSSFGARVVATTQGKTPIADVKGMVLLGYPLHPVDRPSLENARHFWKIPLPMLFIQGIGDAAAYEEALQEAVRAVPKATLTWVQTNDSTLRSIAKRETRSGESGLDATVSAIVGWISALLENRPVRADSAAPDPRLERFDALVGRAEELIAQQLQRIARLTANGHSSTMAVQVLETWRESLELMRWKRDFLRWTLSSDDLDLRVSQPSLLERAPESIRQAIASEVGNTFHGREPSAAEFKEVVDRAVFHRYG